MPTVALPPPVKRKRERLYTQDELAGMLGVCRSTIQKLEADPLRVDPSVLVRYLSVLGWRVGFYPRIRG